MAITTKTPKESFVDFLGNEVFVGDYVVYATTSSRSPVQKAAIVVNINEVTRDSWHAGNRPGRPYTQVGVREQSNGRNFSRWGKDAQGRAKTTYPMVENIVLVKRGSDRG